MKAQELMTCTPVTVDRHASVAEVAKAMAEQRVGCVLVVDSHGKLRGIVTQTDFGGERQGVPFSTEALLQLFSRSLPSVALEKVRRDAQSTMVEQIMVTEVRTASEETPLEEIARLMLRYDIDHIPVVRDGVPVGMVARHDFLRMMVEEPQASTVSPV